MSTPFCYTPETADKICADYLGGMSTYQCAAKYGMGQATIAKLTRRRGISRKSSRDRPPIDAERVIALRGAGYGIKAIGKQIGASHVTIKRMLQGMGAYSEKARHCAATALWAYRTKELDADVAAWMGADRWWYEAHHVRKTHMDHYYANHEESKAYAASKAKEYHARMKHVPWYKIRKHTGNTINRICEKVRTRRVKTGPSIEYLGCRYEQAREHIEAQFKAGMTWDNHGAVWEIDHIVPLAHFDLTDDAQRRAACHYSNLQPLYVHENRTKSDKLEPPVSIFLSRCA